MYNTNNNITAILCLIFALLPLGGWRVDYEQED